MNVLKQQLESIRTNHKLDDRKFTVIDAVRNSTGELEGYELKKSNIIFERGNFTLYLLNNDEVYNEQGLLLIKGYKSHFEKNNILYITDTENDTFKMKLNARVYQNKKQTAKLTNAGWYNNSQGAGVFMINPTYQELSNIIIGNSILLADDQNVLFLINSIPHCLELETGKVFLYSLNNKKARNIFTVDSQYLNLLKNKKEYIFFIDSHEGLEFAHQDIIGNKINKLTYCKFTAQNKPEIIEIPLDFEPFTLERRYVTDIIQNNNILSILIKSAYIESDTIKSSLIDIKFNLINKETTYTNLITKNLNLDRITIENNKELGNGYIQLFYTEIFAKYTDQNKISVLFDYSYTIQEWINTGIIGSGWAPPTGRPGLFYQNTLIIQRDNKQIISENSNFFRTANTAEFIAATETNLTLTGDVALWTKCSLSEYQILIEKSGFISAYFPNKPAGPLWQQQPATGFQEAGSILNPMTVLITNIHNFPAELEKNLIKSIQNTWNSAIYTKSDSMQYQLGQEIILCSPERKIDIGFDWLLGQNLITAYYPAYNFSNFSYHFYPISTYAGQRNLMLSEYNKDKVLQGSSYTQKLVYNPNMIPYAPNFNYAEIRTNKEITEIISGYLEITPAQTNTIYLSTETERGTAIIYENDRQTIYFLDYYGLNKGHFEGFAEAIEDISAVSQGLYIATKYNLYLQRVIGTSSIEYYNDTIDLGYSIENIGEKFTVFFTGSQLIYIYNNRLFYMPYPINSNPLKAVPNKNNILLETADNKLWIITPSSKELALLSLSESEKLTLGYNIKNEAGELINITKGNPKFRFQYYLGNTPLILKKIESYSQIKECRLSNENKVIVPRRDLYTVPCNMLFSRKSQVELIFEKYIGDEITLYTL